MNDDYYAKKKRKLDKRAGRGAPEDAKKKTTVIIVIIVAAVILIAAVAGILVARNLHKKNGGEEPVTALTIPQPSVETATVDPTAWELPSITTPVTRAPDTTAPATAAPTTAAPVTAPTTAAPATIPVPTTAVPVKALPDHPAQGVETSVFEEINNARAQYDFDPYTLDAKLCSLAAVRCAELAQNFSDTRPDGTAFPSIFAEYGISYNKCGESFLSADGIDPLDAVVKLSENDADNQRIFASTSDFNRIGVAVVQIGGTYYLTILYYS